MNSLEVRLPNGQMATGTYRNEDGRAGYVRVRQNGKDITVSGTINWDGIGGVLRFTPRGKNAGLVQ